MPFFVEEEVCFAGAFSIGFRWNDDVHTLRLGRFDDVVGVVTLVADEVLPARGFDERRGFADVVDVTWAEMDVGWITETVHESVDFR